MATALLYILTTICAFAGMEGVAWVAHKYIMHKLLWPLHADHHRKDPGSFLEKNDYFFLIFATPGILCLAIGTFYLPCRLLLYVGIGITLYGLTYFLVHDVFIHRRLKFFRNTNNFYFRAIRRAHKMHHKHLGKEHGECFGMLWVPLKYIREALQQADKEN